MHDRCDAAKFWSTRRQTAGGGKLFLSVSRRQAETETGLRRPLTKPKQQPVLLKNTSELGFHSIFEKVIEHTDLVHTAELLLGLLEYDSVECGCQSPPAVAQCWHRWAFTEFFLDFSFFCAQSVFKAKYATKCRRMAAIQM